MDTVSEVWPRVVPVDVTEGPAERAPDDFDDGYVLPMHSVKPLQTLHTHPLDTHLVFYEVPHVYTFHGVPTSTSVTALAHDFEESFDPTAAIGLMKGGKSQAWPRLEYVVDAVAVLDDHDDAWTPERGLLATSGGKTVAVLPPHSMNVGTATAAAVQVLRSMSAAKAPDPSDFEVYAYERPMMDDEIAAKWKANGQRASHMGTDRHYLAECFFNGLPHRWWEPDAQVLYKFCREHMVPAGMVAFNTEKEIVCADADVAGSIDLIAWDPSRKVYHIIDFKRSDKLQTQLRGFRKMGAPFNHLDDCKGAGYALQTSIYQYILERDYGLTIGDRVLLSLHADAPFCTSVPYMKREVEYIMERRFALVRARKEIVRADPCFACAKTGAPLVDAVMLDDDQTRVMEKMALTEETVSYRPDWETRRAFDAAVAAAVRMPTFDPTGLVSWKRQMPAAGLRPFS